MFFKTSRHSQEHVYRLPGIEKITSLAVVPGGDNLVVGEGSGSYVRLRVLGSLYRLDSRADDSSDDASVVFLHSAYDRNLTDVRVDKDEVLGRGSFSAVYRGKWRGVIVAIKEIGIDGLSDEMRSEDVGLFVDRLKHLKMPKHEKLF